MPRTTPNRIAATTPPSASNAATPKKNDPEPALTLPPASPDAGTGTGGETGPSGRGSAATRARTVGIGFISSATPFEAIRNPRCDPVAWPRPGPNTPSGDPAAGTRGQAPATGTVSQAVTGDAVLGPGSATVAESATGAVEATTGNGAGCATPICAPEGVPGVDGDVAAAAASPPIARRGGVALVARRDGAVAIDPAPPRVEPV